ncbi:MAG: hypothetical protein Q8P46_10485 [Hyphomicrobiales bacterium]|nr:hypothetical protein [Hyphomicrobiales bacterium]
MRRTGKQQPKPKAIFSSGWVNTLAMMESFLGILFLFLIGLALRNRFRI